PALRALFAALESTGFGLPGVDVDLDLVAARLPTADLDEARAALGALIDREQRDPGSLAEPVRRGLLQALFGRLEELRGVAGPHSGVQRRVVAGEGAWPRGAYVAPRVTDRPAPAI